MMQIKPFQRRNVMRTRILTWTAALVLLSLSLSPLLRAEDAPPEITVAKAVICTGVQDRAPVGEGTLFPSTVGKIYCYSLILLPEGETTIHHIWYWEDNRMADVPLTVRAPRFRTYSSKQILPQWKGAWRVELTGPDGKVLATTAFTIE
jgi:hypothetical protein